MSDALNQHVTAYGDGFGYAFDNAVMLNWYPRRIMSLTDSAHSVLELGIGHGYTSNHFAEFYADYSVIDGSELIIKKFKKQCPGSKARVIQSYFENFDSDQTFDLIILGFVLEHVDDPRQILNHFKQFIAPGGRCFVTVPNAESLHRRFGHAAGLLPDMAALGIGDQALGHQRSYTVALMTQELQDCGYQVIRQEGIFLKPFTTSQLKLLDLSAEVLKAMCEIGIDYPELCAGLLFEARLVG